MAKSRYITRRSHMRHNPKTGRMSYVSGCTYIRHTPIRKQKKL